jgi:hypothetical protein
MLEAEWLRLVLSTEDHNYKQNIIIMFWKYLVDIRSEVWLNLFWEYINAKLFVQQKTKTGARRTWEILGLGNGRKNSKFINDDIC